MTNDEKRAIIEDATPAPWYTGEGLAIMSVNECVIPSGEIYKEDIDFIIAARNEWPKDLDRLDKLEKKLAGMEQAKNTFYDDMIRYKRACDNLTDHRDTLHDTIKRQDRQITGAYQQIDELEKKNTELKEIMKEIWIHEYGICNYCGELVISDGVEDREHREDCKVAAVLKEG